MSDIISNQMNELVDQLAETAEELLAALETIHHPDVRPFEEALQEALDAWKASRSDSEGDAPD